MYYWSWEVQDFKSRSGNLEIEFIANIPSLPDNAAIDLFRSNPEWFPMMDWPLVSIANEEAATMLKLTFDDAVVWRTSTGKEV